jgi:hypothetical protein
MSVPRRPGNRNLLSAFMLFSVPSVFKRAVNNLTPQMW